MKAWSTACIPDADVFARYAQGHEVKVHAMVYPDWLADFEPGCHIQVHLTSTSVGHPYHVGTITEIIGQAASEPKGTPEVLVFKVRRLP